MDDEEERLEAGLRDMSLEEGRLDEEESICSELLADPSKFYNLQVGIIHTQFISAKINSGQCVLKCSK